VYLDGLVTKIRDKGVVENKTIYLAVGVAPDGAKDVLGLWIQTTEGAKFWLAILNELKQRGVRDILILCADGLTGMPQAVEAAFPKTIFQTCIVHMIRAGLRYVSWKDRRHVAAALRNVYTAPNAEEARRALDAFEREYGKKHPTIAPMWRARWEEITPFHAFPQEIRRATYTTNAFEAINRRLRKVLKTKGHMPNDEAALKLLYLNLRFERQWMRAPHHWPEAMQQFVIYFEGRLPQ
jgi:transposase-like protein